MASHQSSSTIIKVVDQQNYFSKIAFIPFFPDHLVAFRFTFLSNLKVFDNLMVI